MCDAQTDAVSGFDTGLIPGEAPHFLQLFQFRDAMFKVYTLLSSMQNIFTNESLRDSGRMKNLSLRRLCRTCRYRRRFLSGIDAAM